VGEGENAYEKTIRITRAHLEEDAGKSLHEDFHGMSGIDLNRAGTPLLEIVSEPDMRSSAEAVAYARTMHALVRWINICDGNMQEGSFRCDANVSVRRRGTEAFGTRREIKNLNSFRFMQQAIDFEIGWQVETLEDGGQFEQSTVLFDPATGQTRMMRSKEDAHDYRYFPDPNLLPLIIEPEWIERVRAAMPELPAAMKARFERELGLSAQDATALTVTKEVADYFQATIAAAGAAHAKLCTNWVMGELAARLNKAGLEIVCSPVSPTQLAGLLLRIADGAISNTIARKVFEALWNGEGANADEIIERQGLKQVTDSSAIEAMIEEVIAANPKSVEEFRAGKEKALNALVGQVMKASRGKANPAQVNELMRRRLGV
ncbi:MAG: Asp-tRNA(Asn)/Glu-tRNA(Gln) amidotransferase subunit GatB, partial [Betaproteobacteria bacterium]|nr:Asp-tRNA(Asn)/Glu-tRNA(Gln) amidotransferase subunit GatB [Betaproteobacteria bacterium]